MKFSKKLYNIIFLIELILEKISTFLTINITLSSFFFFLGLYQKYNRGLYSFFIDFVVYGSLISFSSQFLLFIISIFSHGFSTFSLKSLLKMFFILILFILVFSLSILIKERPY